VKKIERMNDNELFDAAQNCGIFARVTPSQKTRIIEVLKKGGKTVGFMGDGINDSPALHIADVGISVNTATDVAKDAASIVLLRKNLSVIADGIKEGRITFQNTVKFILMGTSSETLEIDFCCRCFNIFAVPADDSCTSTFNRHSLRFFSIYNSHR
jgi:Mg2+-importing ATPase